jgi:hypothetical protein
VFAIVSLEATLALFFNCHRCYRSGRPILYIILYSPRRWRRGDPTAACYCIVNRITRGSDLLSHLGVRREFRKFQTVETSRYTRVSCVTKRVPLENHHDPVSRTVIKCRYMVQFRFSTLRHIGYKCIYFNIIYFILLLPIIQTFKF